MRRLAKIYPADAPMSWGRLRDLPPVQQHEYLAEQRASGLSEAELAVSLGTNTKCIHRRTVLLHRTCPSAISLLKGRATSPAMFEVMKCLAPKRQMEVARLLLSMNNFAFDFVKALLAASKQSDLAKPEKPKSIGHLRPARMEQMQREMEALMPRFNVAEKNYAPQALNLVVTEGYVSRIVSNRRIAAYLKANHPNVYEKLAAYRVEPSLDKVVSPGKIGAAGGARSGTRSLSSKSLRRQS